MTFTAEWREALLEMMSFVHPLPGVSEAVTRRFGAPHVIERFRREGSESYEIRVSNRNYSLAAAVEELEHLVLMFPRARTFPEISSLSKLYIISWISLSDILANLINEVFDLGYSEGDIEFGVILRNRKIRGSMIPALVQKHKKLIEHDRYAKLRNDVVHRGKLDDPDVQLLQNDLTLAVIMKTAQVAPGDEQGYNAAAAEAASAIKIVPRMQQLLSSKSESYMAHLRATRDFFVDVAPILIARIEIQP